MKHVVSKGAVVENALKRCKPVLRHRSRIIVAQDLHRFGKRTIGGVGHGRRIDSIFKTQRNKEHNGTPKAKELTKWIHYSKINVDDNGLSLWRTKEEVALTRQRVQALADLISIDGEVLQDLLVRKIDTDEYEIIVGNHRYLACKELVEVRGKSEFEFLPCIVMNISKVRERFMKFSSNGYDQKTDYEIMTEIEEEKYLLTHYPEEFPDINPGPVIDRLVQATEEKEYDWGVFKNK